MGYPELPTSIEAAAKRWQRRELVAWVVRQVLMLGLILWLFPKWPVLWWSLLVIVPLALVAFHQILRIDQIVEKGHEVDEKLRRVRGT